VNPHQQGYSLVEVLVSSVILLAMTYAVATLSISGKEAQDYASRMNRVTEINQLLMDDLRLELTSSVQVFGNDAEGNAHLAMLDLTAFPPLLSSSRLPTPSPTGLLQRDTAGAEITGNSLFFVRQAWFDEFRCTSGNEYRIDVYRWVLFYLTPEDGGPTAGRATGLNLCEFLSEPMADGSQIDEITDPTDREEVLQHLADGTPDMLGETHTPVELVWQRGQDPAVTGTFRQIDGVAGTLSDTPFGGRADPWEIQPDAGGMSRSNLLSYRHHSVGTNFSPSALQVGRFGLEDATGDGFPHGFEVQIVGPSAAREILVHMVVVSTARRGQLAWSTNTVVVDARDM